MRDGPLKSKAERLIERITEYLCVGGFFNPELMEHQKVSDLLIDCREEFLRQRREAP